MAVTRERFAQGMTYDEYKAQMTRNQERLAENEALVTLPAEEVAFFAGLPERLHVLALVEDWCGDVLNNVPVLMRLAEESGTLDVRFFLRDQNPDLMDRYLNEGVHRSIPVFALFDDAFNPLGHWIERPARISAQTEAMLAELYATDPAFVGVERGTSAALLPDEARARLGQAYREFRARTRDESNHEVVRELRALVEGALALEGEG